MSVLTLREMIFCKGKKNDTWYIGCRCCALNLAGNAVDSFHEEGLLYSIDNSPR